MNPFVEECRREWKRLGVPDPVANEMAADLEVDLAEAEADGSSAEEVLGTAAFDAPSFAAAWAAERGVVPRATETVRTRRRVPRAEVAIAGFALVAIIGALLLLTAQASSQTRVALPAPIHVWKPVPMPVPVGARGLVSSSSDLGARIAGAVLLIVGLVGTVLATVFAVLDRPWRRPAAAG